MAKSAIVLPFKVCLRTGLRTIKNENKTIYHEAVINITICDNNKSGHICRQPDNRYSHPNVRPIPDSGGQCPFEKR